MYGHYARYTTDAAKSFRTARVIEDVAATVTGCALTAYAALGQCRLSRTDGVIDAEGTLSFLQVNVAPGVTGTPLMPQAMA